MTSPGTVAVPNQKVPPPNHLQLPDSDGSIVENPQEHPQSNLLTDCLLPRLRDLHAGEQFFIGCDAGIYWRVTDPALAGCKAPDWYYVPNVPAMLEGQYRRSYVLWYEGVRPTVVIEYVSGNGAAEHDITPYTGQFWVYEQGIAAAFYVIFDGPNSTLEVYRLVEGRYQRMQPNDHGRYSIPPVGVEMGLWEGRYRGIEGTWLRVWDVQTGRMMLLSEERAEAAEAILDETRQLLSEETERAEAERKRADEAAERLRKLTEQLRAAGIEPAS